MDARVNVSPGVGMRLLKFGHKRTGQYTILLLVSLLAAIGKTY